ncbi:MAG: hypothetical protein ACERKZ_11365 [Lachnotalea sp.]|nr:hypothetical protein [Candidatus Galacturonibacter soehngenii]
MGYNSKLGQVNSNIQPLGICILCGSSCKGSCSGSCKGGCSKKCDNQCSGSCGNNCTDKNWGSAES